MKKFCQNALAFGSGLFQPHCLNGKVSAIVEFCSELENETYCLCDYCASKLTAKARSKKMRAKVEYIEIEQKIYKKITIIPDTQINLINE